MIKVYICTPYSSNPEEGVKRSIDAYENLANLGYNPFNPLLFHYQNIVYQRPYDYWCKIDRQWLIECDCILRLPGESEGCDSEVDLAKRNGISVFYDIESLHKFYTESNDKDCLWQR
jgi:hypothetical protein